MCIIFGLIFKCYCLYFENPTEPETGAYISFLGLSYSFVGLYVLPFIKLHVFKGGKKMIYCFSSFLYTRPFSKGLLYGMHNMLGPQLFSDHIGKRKIVAYDNFG